MLWLVQFGKRIGSLAEDRVMPLPTTARRVGNMILPKRPAPVAEAILTGDRADTSTPEHQVVNDDGVVLGRFFVEKDEWLGPGRWRIRGNWMPPGDR